MIRVGILGAAGYTGGELIRLLINHPEADIVFANSESNAGNPVAEVHEGLYGDCYLRFTSEMPFNEVDVVFFCFGHGKSEAFLKEHTIPENVKIIDLAQDFRLAAPGNDYVYGLPEINWEKIAKAQHVANPGCFATAIQLALLPLASAGLLKDEIHITAITGSTGAGVKPGATTHFSWRNCNISAYKVFNHQHLKEIGRNLKNLQKDFDKDINFVPVRGDFARGIFASVYTSCGLSEEEALGLYRNYYADSAFCFVSDRDVDLKQVVNTNKCLISLGKHSDKLVVASVIDNLLKGASGQAVQNMNLMFGLPENMGLRLKASAF